MQARLLVAANVLGLFLAGVVHAQQLKSQLSIDVPHGATMVAGETAEWKFNIVDENTQQVHKKFMKMHGKFMHLIIVKKDLTLFSHVHPYLSFRGGEFSLGVNSRSDDPDNFGALTAVPEPGEYYYFNEVMPMPINEKVPMLMGRGGFQATNGIANSNWGAKSSEASFRRTKYFKENGAEGVFGDAYQVNFSFQQFDFCNIWLPKFYVRVSRRSGVDPLTYGPVEKFQPWLGMGGHSIIISHFGDSLSAKKFYHLHGFLPMAEKGKFTFPYDNHSEGMPNGKYNIWSQVKHNNKVFTFSFSFDYDNPPLDLTRACRSGALK